MCICCWVSNAVYFSSFCLLPRHDTNGDSDHVPLSVLTFTTGSKYYLTHHLTDIFQYGNDLKKMSIFLFCLVSLFPFLLSALQSILFWFHILHYYWISRQARIFINFFLDSNPTTSSIFYYFIFSLFSAYSSEKTSF